MNKSATSILDDMIHIKNLLDDMEEDKWISRADKYKRNISALRGYATHFNSCNRSVPGFGNICTCGLDSLMESTK